MRKMLPIVVAVLSAFWPALRLSAAEPAESAATAPTTQPAPHATTAAATEPAEAIASSRVVGVTIYQGNAQVTREVQVSAGKGLTEVVVGPMPPTTIDGSLYTEGSENIRVLSTRFRTRAILEDTREEVRVHQQKIDALTNEDQLLEKQIEGMNEHLAFLAKLENFTSATLAQMTEKGALNAESTLKLADFVMNTRMTREKEIVVQQQKLAANRAAIEFAQRQLAELSSGASHTERVAVISLDKSVGGAGVVKLNYLVGSASWTPMYRFRAAKEKDPVQLEYLAAIMQQSGEDWSDADLVLSTAQPTLTAAPPDLLALDVAVTGPSAANAANNNGGVAQNVRSKSQNYLYSRQLRQQAQQLELQQAQGKPAAEIFNSAAANEQYADLLSAEDPAQEANAKEGPSVAYHLEQKLTVPSRSDQQIVQVSRIDLQPTYFYKTVPVLSAQVYRLANLDNKSQYVLLPGEATMYQGSDFVGRMSLPLVAIGEQFTVGFGVDPQIQVERRLVNKAHTIQGGNQVQTNDYRIRVSSFKADPVELQVWDRIPRGEGETVAVEVVKSTPEISADAGYLRADRPRNLLRWDVQLKPGVSGEQAFSINYQFRLQYDRNVTIADFVSK